MPLRGGTVNNIGITLAIIEESACRTLYQVIELGVATPFQIELGMICNGEPCLWFKHQHSYTAWSLRFPIVECYTRPYWNEESGRYMHQYLQDPVQGPRVEDVLPRGFQDFWEFFEKSVVCFQMCTLRYRELPRPLPLISRAVIDPIDRVRVHLELTASHNAPFRVPYVAIVSNAYAGNGDGCLEKMQLFPEWWRQWCQILPKGWLTWDQISAEQFRDICAHMRNCRKAYLKGTR
jgi:hypothetical protein